MREESAFFSLWRVRPSAARPQTDARSRADGGEGGAAQPLEGSPGARVGRTAGKREGVKRGRPFQLSLSRVSLLHNAPVAGADLRAALVASCLRGALPPVDLRAVCFVRAIVGGERLGGVEGKWKRRCEERGEVEKTKRGRRGERVCVCPPIQETGEEHRRTSRLERGRGKEAQQCTLHAHWPARLCACGWAATQESRWATRVPFPALFSPLFSLSFLCLLLASLSPLPLFIPPFSSLPTPPPTLLLNHVWSW